MKSFIFAVIVTIGLYFLMGPSPVMLAVIFFVAWIAIQLQQSAFARSISGKEPEHVATDDTYM